MKPLHVKSETYHRRLGDTKNSFRYGVDYVLTEPENSRRSPLLFSHDRSNAMSLRTQDHGGIRGDGEGVDWVRKTLRDLGYAIKPAWRVLLLAQPRMLGTKFTPVSFWFVVDGEGGLRVAIAEVNNTFGERHNYICALPDLAMITPNDVIQAAKIFHVSPFQKVEGTYRFTFDVSHDEISIRIDYRSETGGLLATLKGSKRPLTNISIINALVRRPLGSLRVLSLIHYQALRLWLGGAGYNVKPQPPAHNVSR